MWRFRRLQMRRVIDWPSSGIPGCVTNKNMWIDIQISNSFLEQISTCLYQILKRTLIFLQLRFIHQVHVLRWLQIARNRTTRQARWKWEIRGPTRVFGVRAGRPWVIRGCTHVGSIILRVWIIYLLFWLNNITLWLKNFATQLNVSCNWSYIIRWSKIVKDFRWWQPKSFGWIIDCELILRKLLQWNKFLKEKLVCVWSQW